MLVSFTKMCLYRHSTYHLKVKNEEQNGAKITCLRYEKEKVM